MTTGNDTPNRRVTKSNTSQTRRLKVNESYHDYQLKQTNQERTPIGSIQLKGHWLIQAGFNIDQPVTVRVMDKCLVLTTE